MAKNKWYDSTPQQLEIKLNTGLYTGLTQNEAARRRRNFGENDIYPFPRADFRRLLVRQLADPTWILLILVTALAVLYEQIAGAALIVGLMAFNLAAGIFTFVRAQRLLESNGRQALPTAHVMRESKLYLIAHQQLVPGDIVFLSTGDVVPADCRLATAEKLTVLEHPLTGLPRSVRKNPDFIDHHDDLAPQFQQNMVFAGTIVTGGSARAIVCATGEDTAIAAADKAATVTTHQQLPVFQRLKRYCSAWSMIGLALVAALTVFTAIWDKTGQGLFSVFLTGLALAVSAMSEFYTAFGYIMVACGVFGSANRKKALNTGALIKNTAKLDKLRDITAIVAPKESFLALRGASLRGVYDGRDFHTPDEKTFRRSASAILRYAVLSTGLYGSANLMAKNARGENVYSPDENLILAAAEKAGVYDVSLEQRYPLLDHRPVSRVNRFDTALMLVEGGCFVVLRGEAQQVLLNCTTYTDRGKIHPMSAEKRDALSLFASQTTKEACRVVAVATRSTHYTNLTRLPTCQSELNFEGFLCIREPILPDAAKNILACQKAGIKVIMTSSDSGDANRYLAAALGLVNDERQIGSAEELRNARPAIRTINSGRWRLIQGVTAEDKALLIQALRDGGEKVAVLAENLDDIALLASADVGFSQSNTLNSRSRDGVDVMSEAVSTPVGSSTTRSTAQNGCEAAKFLSDVIVSTPSGDGSGGFNGMLSAITGARVIYLNLLRAVRYLLTVQSARFALILWAAISQSAGLSAVQILFAGLIMDFFAVLGIAFERPTADILNVRIETEQKLAHPLRHNLESIGFGLLWAILTAAIPPITAAIGFRMNASGITALFFVSSLFTQLIAFAAYKKERSAFYDIRFNFFQAIFAALFALFMPLAATTFAPAFSLEGLSWPIFGLSLLVPALMLGAFELYKLICGGSLTKERSLTAEAVEGVRSMLASGFMLEGLMKIEEEEEEKRLATAHFDIIRAPAIAQNRPEEAEAPEVPETPPEEPSAPPPQSFDAIDRAVDNLLNSLGDAVLSGEFDENKPLWEEPIPQPPPDPSLLEESDPYLDEINPKVVEVTPPPAEEEPEEIEEEPQPYIPAKPPFEETLLIQPGDMESVLRQIAAAAQPPRPKHPPKRKD